MTDDLDALRDAWADQTVDGRRFSEDELRARGQAFERTIRRRNLRELVAAAFVVATFGYAAVVRDLPFARVGSVLCVLGALRVAWVIWTRASPPRPDGSVDGRTWLVSELTRQRDLLRDVWRWYLGPLVPGLVVLPLDREASDLWWLYGIFAVVFAGVHALNRMAARAIDREIGEVRDA
ncbi:MAG: hypothetical protein H6737_14015 [Alphaproteobacteria bacterium]|nr:hypothetical protein [Alphaproteobacteria bacterium]